MNQPQFPPLAVSHFPPPHTCQACGHTSAWTVDGLSWCVSSTCDPHGYTWRALDRYFRKQPTIERSNEP